MEWGDFLRRFGLVERMEEKNRKTNWTVCDG